MEKQKERKFEGIKNFLQEKIKVANEHLERGKQIFHNPNEYKELTLEEFCNEVWGYIFFNIIRNEYPEFYEIVLSISEGDVRKAVDHGEEIVDFIVSILKYIYPVWKEEVVPIGHLLDILRDISKLYISIYLYTKGLKVKYKDNNLRELIRKLSNEDELVEEQIKRFYMEMTKWLIIGYWVYKIVNRRKIEGRKLRKLLEEFFKGFFSTILTASIGVDKLKDILLDINFGVENLDEFLDKFLKNWVKDEISIKILNHIFFVLSDKKLRSYDVDEKIIMNRLKKLIDMIADVEQRQILAEVKLEDIEKFLFGQIDEDYFEREYLASREIKEIRRYFGREIESVLKNVNIEKLNLFMQIYPRLPKKLRIEIIDKGLLELFLEKREVFTNLSSFVIEKFINKVITFEELIALSEKFKYNINKIIEDYLELKVEYNLPMEKFLEIYDNLNRYKVLWSQIENIKNLLKEAKSLGYHDKKFLFGLENQLSQLDIFGEIEDLQLGIKNIEEQISKSGVKDFVKKRKKYYEIYKGKNFGKDFNFVNKFLKRINFPKNLLEDRVKKLLAFSDISEIVDILEKGNLEEILRNKTREEKIKFIDNLIYILSLDIKSIINKQGKKGLVDTIIHYDFDKYADSIYYKINDMLNGVLTDADFRKVKKIINVYCKKQKNMEDLYMCKKAILDEIYYLVKKIVKYGGEEAGIEFVSFVLGLSDMQDITNIMNKIDLAMDILFVLKEYLSGKQIEIEDILQIEDEILLDIIRMMWFLSNEQKRNIIKNFMDSNKNIEDIKELLNLLYDFLIREIRKTNTIQYNTINSDYVNNRQIRETLAEFLGGKKVTAFTYEDVEDLVNQLEAQGHKISYREGGGDHKIFYINGVLVTIPTHKSYPPGTICSIFKGITKGVLNGKEIK